jgi:uncharacterized membrane protein
MDKGRLEAFSDGVIAIIITIMVLELKAPHGTGFDASWLSLIPFVTAWMDGDFATAPVAIYGAVLLMSGIAYYILARILVRENGPESKLAQAFGNDFKGIASIVVYALAIAASPWNPWAALGLYVLVAIVWVIPDRRIERK